MKKREIARIIDSDCRCFLGERKKERDNETESTKERDRDSENN